MVCEIIVGDIIAIRIQVYIKHKISLLRDWDAISGYEGLNDVNVLFDCLERKAVIEIRVRKDPLKSI